MVNPPAAHAGAPGVIAVMSCIILPRQPQPGSPSSAGSPSPGFRPVRARQRGGAVGGGQGRCRVGWAVAHPSPSPDPDKEISTIRLFR